MSARLPLHAVHAAAGASFVEDMGFELPADHGDPDREAERVRLSAGVVDRSYRGLVDLSGKDVRTFLDGIFSSDVGRLSAGQGQSSAFLTPKGRLLAAFALHALPGGSYRMAFLEPVRQTVLDALSRYAFLGGTAIADRSRDLAVLSVEGPRAAEVIERALGGKPPAAARAGAATFELRVLAAGGAGVTVTGGGESPEGGFDCWVPAPAVEPVWRALLEAAGSVGGGPVGSRAAEALRIEAGLPRHGKDHDDALPAEVGWDRALTYDKCYVGQEIVARMKTYGHANRKLRGLLMPGRDVPLAGSPISFGGEEAGRITSAAFSARLGRAVALGMVPRKFWEAAAADVEVAGARVPAEVQDLPLVRVDGPARSG